MLSRALSAASRSAGARGFHTCKPANAKLGLEAMASRVPLAGQNVLIRLDLNVPLSKDDGKTVTNDKRLRAVVPTLKFLSEQGARTVIATHIGRPKGQVNDAMRTEVVVPRLSELIDVEVQSVNDCVGDAVKAASAGLSNGAVLLTENVRFYGGETKNDAELSAALADASNARLYVNDAFGTAHRAHSSTAGVCAHMDLCAAGYLMDKELQYLQGAVQEPVRPLAAVIGGAKVSTKVPVIDSLLDKCDSIFIGGGMIFTFYRAMGLDVGASMVEEDLIPLARELMDKAKVKGVNFVLPSDVVVAEKFAEDAAFQQVPVEAIPEGWMGLDIGADSINQFSTELTACKTVVWNGPMGVFEFANFAKGTYAVADALAAATEAGATSIIGGGDSVAAVEKAGLGPRMSHISTGGGASLELLEGKVLPGVAALTDV